MKNLNKELVGSGNGFKCPYCKGDVKEIGNILNYGIGEYECVERCDDYMKQDGYLGTRHLLEAQHETTSS